MTMYDVILKLQLPKGATIIGFANDIAVTIMAQDIQEIEVFTSETIFEIRSRLGDAGLTLAEHKTERQPQEANVDKDHNW